jgi:hypothetical protein
MLKRFSIAVALIATLGLAFAIVVPSASFAKNQNQNKNVHVNKKVVVQKNVVVHKNAAGNKFVVGKKYNGHVWYGHNRHRWHDHWYAYGEGPCWISIDGLWFWNEAACS